MVHSFAVSDQDFKNLDNVEIKMTIADDQKAKIRALLPTDLDPQKLWIYFFDTIDLQLFDTYSGSQAGKVQSILREQRLQE
jgi:hypothetical protein